MEREKRKKITVNVSYEKGLYTVQAQEYSDFFIALKSRENLEHYVREMLKAYLNLKRPAEVQRLHLPTIIFSYSQQAILREYVNTFGYVNLARASMVSPDRLREYATGIAKMQNSTFNKITEAFKVLSASKA